MDKTKPRPFLDAERAEVQRYRERMQKRDAGTLVIEKLPRLRVPSNKGTRKHLIIGDSHSHCDEGNQRFESLGRMVKEIKPDVVIDIGDSADMSSLLMYESGSKAPIFEGFSYWRDIDAYHDAKGRFHHYLGKPANMPRLVRIIGNHENRIDRVLEIEPRFRGVIGIDDLGDEDIFKWEVAPFLEPWLVDGVVYSHYFKSPGGHRPVSGIMPARAVVMKYPGSFTRVFGHTHSFGFFEEADGMPGEHFKKISSINAGCYFDQSMSGMRWSGTDKNRWRSGILVIDVDLDGQLRSWRWFDYWEIQRRWGK
jgi:predicted phosphodiesterase